MVTPLQYARALYEIVIGKNKDDATKEIKRFAAFLMEQNKSRMVPLITKEFERIWNKENGIRSVKVTSGRPLDAGARKELEKFGSVRGKVDESLLGGLQVQIDDILIDGSVSGRLMRLGMRMKE